MTGLIWLIQLVHYPSFKKIDPKKFQEFHSFHSKKITPLVFPLMSIELLFSVYFSWLTRDSFWLVQFLLVLLIWGATIFVSVPIHNKLSEYNESKIDQLVTTNWIRTILWSLKSLLVIIN